MQVKLQKSGKWCGREIKDLATLLAYCYHIPAHVPVLVKQSVALIASCICMFIKKVRNGVFARTTTFYKETLL